MTLFARSTPPDDAPGFARAFRRAFPGADDAEVAFLAEVLGGLGDRDRILDLGCGTARLGPMIKSMRRGGGYVGMDIDGSMLRLASPASHPSLLRADFSRLPFASGAFGSAVSGLLSLNYASTPSEFTATLIEAGRVVRTGGVLSAELAIAWRPERLAGLAERHGDFEFLYHDALSSDSTGATLRAEMRIGGAVSHFMMFVPAIGTLADTLERAGWTLDALYAPHDLASRTLHPPHDCLRGIVVARRR